MKNSRIKITILVCFITLFCALLPLISSGCQRPNPLIEKVSELRSNVYRGECQYFTLRATYGFKETPYVSDGNLGEKVYSLEFKIEGHTSINVQTIVILERNGNEYRQEFKLDPVTHSVKAKIEIEDFSEKTFTVTVLYGSTTSTIELRSIVPENAIDYKTALESLYNEQSSLISKYLDDDKNFIGEITARILVKDNHPYWYVGLTSSSGELKALLIDGITKEVLAIREIF